MTKKMLSCKAHSVLNNCMKMLTLHSFTLSCCLACFSFSPLPSIHFLDNTHSMDFYSSNHNSCFNHGSKISGCVLLLLWSHPSLSNYWRDQQSSSCQSRLPIYLFVLLILTWEYNFFWQLVLLLYRDVVIVLSFCTGLYKHYDFIQMHSTYGASSSYMPNQALSALILLIWEKVLDML